MVGAGLPGKALGGVRVAVGVGDIGLDIVDGGAVHQVGTAHDEHRPHVRALLNGLQPVSYTHLDVYKRQALAR